MIPQIWARVLPLALRQEIASLRETLSDGWRYQRASTAYDRWSEERHLADRHEARLTMDYHRIEKSLTLPEPRRPFGLGVRDRMTNLLDRRPVESQNRPYVAHAERALTGLDYWNHRGMVDDDVSPIFEPPRAQIDAEQAQMFFASRHSVRNFDTDRTPAASDLVQVVELARNTPSVCNRQGFRVHFFRERKDIEAILRIQNGAVGFAESVPVLAVVTARRAMFVGPDERNQRWVDGGLFAMTLVWAAHALGLSTCMLNWALPSASSARLRKLTNIADGEDIVVLIAIGHAAQGARVARSEKRTVDDLATFHS